MELQIEQAQLPLDEINDSPASPIETKNEEGGSDTNQEQQEAQRKDRYKKEKAWALENQNWISRYNFTPLQVETYAHAYGYAYAYICERLEKDFLKFDHRYSFHYAVIYAIAFSKKGREESDRMAREFAGRFEICEKYAKRSEVGAYLATYGLTEQREKWQKEEYKQEYEVGKAWALKMQECNSTSEQVAQYAHAFAYACAYLYDEEENIYSYAAEYAKGVMKHLADRMAIARAAESPIQQSYKKNGLQAEDWKRYEQEKNKAYDKYSKQITKNGEPLTDTECFAFAEAYARAVVVRQKNHEDALRDAAEPLQYSTNPDITATLSEPSTQHSILEGLLHDLDSSAALSPEYKVEAPSTTSLIYEEIFMADEKVAAPLLTEQEIFFSEFMTGLQKAKTPFDHPQWPLAFTMEQGQSYRRIGYNLSKMEKDYREINRLGGLLKRKAEEKREGYPSQSALEFSNAFLEFLRTPTYAQYKLIKGSLEGNSISDDLKTDFEKLQKHRGYKQIAWYMLQFLAIATVATVITVGYTLNIDTMCAAGIISIVFLIPFLVVAQTKFPTASGNHVYEGIEHMVRFLYSAKQICEEVQKLETLSPTQLQVQYNDPQPQRAPDFLSFYNSKIKNNVPENQSITEPKTWSGCCNLTSARRG